ncbi:MAG: hypothetical protein Q4B52_05435 [Tissierellia bacterium]|nr:hypothetical protein [Tissierellia bacterium]
MEIFGNYYSKKKLAIIAALILSIILLFSLIVVAHQKKKQQKIEKDFNSLEKSNEVSIEYVNSNAYEKEDLTAYADKEKIRYDAKDKANKVDLNEITKKEKDRREAEQEQEEKQREEQKKEDEKQKENSNNVNKSVKDGLIADNRKSEGKSLSRNTNSNNRTNNSNNINSSNANSSNNGNNNDSRLVKSEKNNSSNNNNEKLARILEKMNDEIKNLKKEIVATNQKIEERDKPTATIPTQEGDIILKPEENKENSDGEISKETPEEDNTVIVDVTLKDNDRYLKRQLEIAEFVTNTPVEYFTNIEKIQISNENKELLNEDNQKYTLIFNVDEELNYESFLKALYKIYYRSFEEDKKQNFIDIIGESNDPEWVFADRYYRYMNKEEDLEDEYIKFFDDINENISKDNQR